MYSWVSGSADVVSSSHPPLLLSSPPGPSTAIDTACSSSLLALENAFHAIQQGHCDAALVGGVNLLLKPNTSVQFMKLGMLSPEGACKSFDASGKRKLPAALGFHWLPLHFSFVFKSVAQI